MKKALVLGASGSMGSAIVSELIERNIEVRVFSRNKEKLQSLFNDKEVVIIAGDVFNKKELRDAAAGVDVIFHAINIPYQEWEEKLADLMNNIVDAAKESKARLAIVDNIYAYGRSRGIPLTEEMRKNPHTKKGKLRLEAENMAKESGIPMFIAHFPDFYGPNAGSTLLNYTLESMVKNKKARFVGDQAAAREYIFTPDGAKAMVELALNDKAYGQNWNIPGTSTITGTEILQMAKQATGYSRHISKVSKGMIRFFGFFDKFMKEYLEMYYLTEEPVVLDGSKYEREIGPVPRTPYRIGIEITIAQLRG
ncbi:SDR family NAD(P)-dependent oxidoreductase [Peribacillus glennii]|uniref:SDR family NAD(P)-dependent oxidoreductase n=1 Tax=Peribacillus glennii TaxID=2303991 RepID=A0A372LCR6_9BACI|nr:SDR family NAD(P)-dependent oxidoreductase [Peribacillus glennii]RFU62884.1 SDR family NAD(P)-dependent oxidoreductase [Peribacillus glennii]